METKERKRPLSVRYRFSISRWDVVDPDVDDPNRPLLAEFDWSAHFLYSYGHLSRFFREIKENCRLMATRCPECGIVRCPPAPDCPKCYVSGKWVPLSGEGMIYTYTIVRSPRAVTSEYKGKVPYILAYVKLDGADNLYPEQIVEMENVERVSIGMRVKAKFGEERKGRNTDFVFVPFE